MDMHRFDALTRVLAVRDTRRNAAALLGSVLATLLLTTEPSTAKKKRKKKVTLCHNGQTIKVAKKARNQFLLDGATLGACAGTSPPPPPPPPPPTCTDGIKNGNETGVDCGGSCPVLCPAGQGCSTHDDCAGAWCSEGDCQACVDFNDCDSGCLCQTTATGNICVDEVDVVLVANCNECPAGTVQCTPLLDQFLCRHRCGPA